MRRTLAAAALLAVIASPALAAGTMMVSLDKSERVSLNGSAANIFIGNSSIADVAIINRNTLVVTGKGYGRTNILVLNGNGQIIMDRDVQVSPGNDGHMTLYRAGSPSNYACAPTCERTAMPGEPGPGTFEVFNPPVETYQKRQTTGGGGAATK